MSAQLPLPVAPVATASRNLTAIPAAVGNVTHSKDNGFSGVLTDQLVQTVGAKEAGVSPIVVTAVTAAAEVLPAALVATLPPGGNALPVSGGDFINPNADSGGQATGPLIELSDEAVDASVLAPPFVVVTVALAADAESGLSETGSRHSPIGFTLATRGQDLIGQGQVQATRSTTGRLPLSPSLLPDRGATAVADTAQSQAVFQARHISQLQDSSLFVGERTAADILPTNSHRLLEQFSEAKLRPGNAPTQTAAIATPAFALSPSGASANVATTGLQQVSIDVPVQHEQWQRVFAERVVFAVGNNQSAQIRITPAELGPIDIHVDMSKDQTSIVFNTQHAAVKELIESSLPRLREMLASEGLELGDVDVRHDDGQTTAKQNHTHGGDHDTAAAGQSADDKESLVVLQTVSISNHAVDYFA